MNKWVLGYDFGMPSENAVTYDDLKKRGVANTEFFRLLEAHTKAWERDGGGKYTKNNHLTAYRNEWNAWVENNKDETLGFSGFTFQLDDQLKLLIDKDYKGDPRFNFKDFDFCTVNFSNATFKGEASFSEATFEGYADFSNAATFEGEASFWRARFKGESDFNDATFKGEASFSEATFEGYADFSNFATFEGEANFWNARFKGESDFSEATFTGEAGFRKARFEGKANFSDATFSGKGTFMNATFTGGVDFSDATFSGEANFRYAKFEGEATFMNATFAGEADFMNATFEGGTNFSDATFEGGADFSHATFSGKGTFMNAMFTGGVDFIDATFEGVAYFMNATFEGEANLSNATFKGAAYFLDINLYLLYYCDANIIKKIKYAENLTDDVTVNNNWDKLLETLKNIFPDIEEKDISVVSNRLKRVKQSQNAQSDINFSDAKFEKQFKYRFGQNIKSINFSDATFLHTASFNCKKNEVNCSTNTVLDFSNTIFEKLPNIQDHENWRKPVKLNPQNESAYRELKSHFKNKNDHEKELDYFKLEMECKKENAKGIHGVLFYLYEKISKYGTSYKAPLTWYIALTLIFYAIGNSNHIIKNLSNSMSGFPWIYTLWDQCRHLTPRLIKNMIPFLPIDVDNGIDRWYEISVSLLSIPLVFLFILGLKNRFKLK